MKIPFNKIKPGMTFIVGQTKKPFGKVITTGLFSALAKKHDDNGEAKEALQNGDVEDNDKAVAIKIINSAGHSTGGSVVYAYDDLEEFDLEITEAVEIPQQTDEEKENMNKSKIKEAAAKKESEELDPKATETVVPKKESADDDEVKETDDSKKEGCDDSKKESKDEELPVGAEMDDPDDKDDDEMDEKSSKKEAVIARVEAEANAALEAEKTAKSNESINELIASDATLSEDFKAKAGMIFEAAVALRVSEEVASIRNENAVVINAALEREMDAITEKVDSYLAYAVETMVEDNAETIESKLRNEVTESFMTKLKAVFEEHYAEMPEGKFDLYEDLSKKSTQTSTELEETKTQLEKVTSELTALRRAKILAEASKGLCDTQAERLVALTEMIDFVDEVSFAKSVSLFKETYFNNGTSESIKKSERDVTINTKIVEELDDSEKVDSVMGRYVDAISRHSKTA